MALQSDDVTGGYDDGNAREWTEDALTGRPRRAVDYQIEHAALCDLIETLTATPDRLLQDLVGKVRLVCGVDSAGVSLPEVSTGQATIRVHAVAGEFSAAAGQTMPRSASPCGRVMDLGVPLLFEHPERRFDYDASLQLPIVESLVVPIRAGDETVGTIWTMFHASRRPFDGEDLRFLRCVASLAATVHQLVGTAERVKSDFDLISRLHRLGAQLVRQGHIDRLLEEILDVAIAIGGANFGSIQLYDEEAGYLRIAAQRGFADWWVDFWHSVRPGEGSSGEAMARGDRVIVEDIEQSFIFLGTPSYDIQRRAGVRGVQSTPLLSRSGRLLGMFSTHYREPCRLDRRALILLDLLAWQAADLIDQVRKSQAMQRIEDRFRLLVEKTSALTWSCHPSGLPEVPQPSWMAFTGQTSEEMLGTGWGNAVHPDDVADAFQQWTSSIRQRIPVQMEYRVRRFDGEWRWMSVHAVPVLDEAGEVLEWLGMNLDITERKQLEEVLVRRTNRLQSLFDTAHDAILMLDHEGWVLYANPASERLLGCSQEELLGRNISTLVFTDGRGSSEHGIQWKHFFDEEGHAFREIRDLYAKGCQGNLFRVELVAGGTGPDRHSACFLRDVTERNDLQRHVLNVAAEEQRRLAYELHDGVQQELVGLSLLAKTLCSYLEEFDDLPRQVRGQGVGGNGTSDDSQGFSAKDLAERLSLGLMETQRNLRELVHGMVPSLDDPDALRVALENLVERLRTKVSCEFNCSGDVLVADGDVSFQVYRIVQEAFTNALRHSGAKTLSLSLKGAEDDLVVEVSDDGVGVDLSVATSGMGLRTMRYRINMIGGALAIENRPEGGTTVRCIFPRDRASSDGRVPQ